MLNPLSGFKVPKTQVVKVSTTVLKPPGFYS